MRRFWLSFADDRKPLTEQLLGVCIVEGVDGVSAIKMAHALGINPGGDVMFLAIDEKMAERLTFDLTPYMDRLIPPAEARELSARIRAELARPEVLS